MTAPRKRGGQDLAAGTRFGRYEIVRRIGEGGMATVYEAMQVDIEKRVALKLLHPWHALREDVVQRFVNEAKAASRIEHPNVMGIYDMGVENDVPFMTMDLLEGEELWAVLHREKGIPLQRLADMLVPLCSAVFAAHEKGILHRDIKPENIFLAKRRPRGEHPVLLDFGISKLPKGTLTGNITATGEVLGTPPYMAPEQVQFGMDRFDAKSDQYAIGVVLYEAATAVLPFPEEEPLIALMRKIAKGGAPPPSSHRPGLPPEFDTLVAKAMAVDPAARFDSVHELGKALLPFAGPLIRSVWSEEFDLPAPELGSFSLPPPPVSLPGSAAPVSTPPARHISTAPGLGAASAAQPPAPPPVASVPPARASVAPAKAPAPETNPRPPTIPPARGSVPPARTSFPPAGSSLPPPRASKPPARPALDPDRLRVVPGLAACPTADLAILLELAPPTRLTGGAVLFEAGTPADSMWLLISGEIEVSARTPALGMELRAGSVLGAASIAHRGPRPVTATAASEAVVVELRRETFDALLAQAPRAALGLLETLSHTAIRLLRAVVIRFPDLVDDPSWEARAEAQRLSLGALEWSLGAGARRPRGG